MIAVVVTLIAILFSQLSPDRAAVMAGPVFMSTVLILGIPHGTVDPFLLFSKKRSSQWLGIRSRIFWVVAYLGIALAYGVVWYQAPFAGLVFFLILTAVHWGTSEYSQDGKPTLNWWALGLSRGALVVIGVLALQPLDSQKAIQLVSGSVDEIILPVTALRALLFVVVLAHFACLLVEFKGDRNRLISRMIDSALILVLLALTPAFLGMAVYYMFFHAERYYRFFGGEAKSLLRSTHLVCALFCSAIWLLVVRFDLFSAESLPKHFMILAALTLPHALLVLRLQQRGLSSIPTPLAG